MPTNVNLEVTFESTVRHLCANCLASVYECGCLSSISVAGKYFQIAAFAMLIYDHSRSSHTGRVC